MTACPNVQGRLLLAAMTSRQLLVNGMGATWSVHAWIRPSWEL